MEDRVRGAGFIPALFLAQPQQCAMQLLPAGRLGPAGGLGDFPEAGFEDFAQQHRGAVGRR